MLGYFIFKDTLSDMIGKSDKIAPLKINHNFLKK